MHIVFCFIYPVLLMFLPVLLYQLVMLALQKKSTATHYLWTYIFIIYVWMVFSVTGAGTIWDLFARGGIWGSLKQANISLIPFQSDGLLTYALNILMTVPLGFLLPFIWKNFRSASRIALTGFLFSACIELSQIPTNRLTDIDDLMMNTIGAVLGYIIWKAISGILFRKRQNARTKPLSNAEPVLYLLLAFLCHFFLYNWKWAL